MQNLNGDFVTSQKNWQKMEKDFRLKLLELCKTRSKKSSPDMFNFYVDLASHDILGLPRAGENSKPHDYKQKYKKWRTFRKHGF